MSAPESVSTEAVMDEVRRRLRAELYPLLVAQGAGDDFDSRSVFDEVDRLFEQALAHEQPSALLLPERLPNPWRLALSLDFSGHRRGLAGRMVRFAKARIVLPVVRWLFEYANQNFRRQQHLNVALMACLQTLAADQARLKARLAEVERRLGEPSR